ncbi:hypothetical protein Pmani_017496 [Petrolisthes manimaculis]|uniref:Uncharacterized protein n=1 Tax=Petrolisthes manimaculis TaxID=1843537 RepID=A0AAE1PM75_9EUCA|nr:hypothetical protein Pmani_017496 [Petrolisthes manimaculis]
MVMCWLVEVRTNSEPHKKLPPSSNFFYPQPAAPGGFGNFGLFHGGLFGSPMGGLSSAPHPPATTKPVPLPTQVPSYTQPNMMPGGVPPQAFLADAGSNILGYRGSGGATNPNALLQSLIPMPGAYGYPGSAGNTNNLKTQIDFKPVIIVPSGKLDEAKIKEILEEHHAKTQAEKAKKKKGMKG